MKKMLETLKRWFDINGRCYVMSQEDFVEYTTRRYGIDGGIARKHHAIANIMNKPR